MGTLSIKVVLAVGGCSSKGDFVDNAIGAANTAYLPSLDFQQAAQKHAHGDAMGNERHDIAIQIKRPNKCLQARLKIHQALATRRRESIGIRKPRTPNIWVGMFGLMPGHAAPGAAVSLLEPIIKLARDPQILGNDVGGLGGASKRRGNHVRHRQSLQHTSVLASLYHAFIGEWRIEHPLNAPFAIPFSFTVAHENEFASHVFSGWLQRN